MGDPILGDQKLESPISIGQTGPGQPLGDSRLWHVSASPVPAVGEVVCVPACVGVRARMQMPCMYVCGGTVRVLRGE